ncbi:MgtC/SapB family protein [Salinarimonas rosea]|uniref:MgtC/SapB family protein n=1 Tax=Salinarimonas rosea TaxID=552063 RepID=UPI0003F6D64F|nr:MgtC/SapB family protein [Salinarimonas rosea]
MVDEILYSGEIPLWDVTVRLLAAAVGGMLLGLDRELRGRATGLRTHGMVSLSSCVITISAFLVYEQALATGDQVTVDPLRAIQGLAQAIGFIAAGAIFVSKGDVRNLTSAANLWLAAAFGIALGSGQYTLAAVAVVFGMIMMSLVRMIELKLHLKRERDAD